ncbi:MAG TPA: hypothetical protein VFZ61_23855 [Polyangiales bacterium]
MNKLPPDAASLLAQARESDRAHQVDLDTTLRKLHATLPFAALGPASAPSAGDGLDVAGALGNPPPSMPPTSAMGGSALAGAATMLGGKAVKVFLATVVLGGAVGGASLMGAPAERIARRAPQTSAVVASRSPETTTGAPRSKLNESASREIAAPVRARTPEDKRAPATQRNPRAARASSRADTAAAGVAPDVVAPSATQPTAELAEAQALPPPAPAQVVESELDLIDAALAQLRAGSGGGALTLLQRHAERYPRGRFRTEREGLRVLALCESGALAQGRDAQARFLRSAGDAPIAAQVRLACAEKAVR